MTDATLAQGNELIGLILREENPHDFLQSLLEKYGSVQTIGRRVATQAESIEVLKHIETRNPYASEREDLGATYPDKYFPDSVETQAFLLKAYYPWLDISRVSELAERWGPNAVADGLTVIPKPTRLAEVLKIKDPWDKFGELTEKGPLVAIGSNRQFNIHLAGQLTSELYRIAPSTRSALTILESEQPDGDVLVFPVQSGRFYTGFSPRNANWEIEHTVLKQWPLPAYVVAWLLFCNPHRLAQTSDLAINCSGDHIRIDSGEPSHVLYFRVSVATLCCFAYKNNSTAKDWGTASGFLE